MSRIAKLDNKNIVEYIIEVDESSIDEYIASSEDKYIQVDNVNAPIVGYTYNELTGRFIPPQPFPSWKLINDKWTAPEESNLRNEFYGYENESSSGMAFLWDEEKRRWKASWTHGFFEQENTRDYGFFFVYKCKNVSEFSKASDFLPSLNVKCAPNAYNYHEVHPDWVDGYIEPIFAENGYGHEFGANLSNPIHSYVYDEFRVIYDGAPYFRIMFAKFLNLNKPNDNNHYELAPELEEIHLKQHPQLAARSLGELFRLIIDWDLAKHYFGNNENIANLAHDVLGAMDMPENIYNLIINNFKPSPVARYIQGDTDALNLGEKEMTPPELINYFKEIYYDFRHLKTHEIPNVSSVNEVHYHI